MRAVPNVRFVSKTPSSTVPDCANTVQWGFEVSRILAVGGENRYREPVFGSRSPRGAVRFHSLLVSGLRGTENRAQRRFKQFESRVTSVNSNREVFARRGWRAVRAFYALQVGSNPGIHLNPCPGVTVAA